MWATVRDLVDQVFHANQSILAQMLLDLLVGLDGDPGTCFFHASALVHQLRYGLSAGISIGDVGLNESEHLDGGFVERDKNAIVELSESQQSQYFPGLGMDGVDTIFL